MGMATLVPDPQPALGTAVVEPRAWETQRKPWKEAEG